MTTARSCLQICRRTIFATKNPSNIYSLSTKRHEPLKKFRGNNQTECYASKLTKVSHKTIAGPTEPCLSLHQTRYSRNWAPTEPNSRRKTTSSIQMSTLATTDLGDAHPSLLATGELRALQPVFREYGLRRAFHGRVVTVKVFEDNVLVRQLLESSPRHGPGSVLVIDGGGSLRCALVGGNLAQLACSNGWAGIVVNGCVRDVDEINAYDIGVRALGSHPLKSIKKGHGDKHVPVYVAGTRIEDGEWLYADMDGVLVSKTPLALAE